MRPSCCFAVLSVLFGAGAFVRAQAPVGKQPLRAGPDSALRAAPSAAQVVAATPQAVDSVLVRPVAQLTPEQIAGMQKRLLDWADLGRFRAEDEQLPPAGPDRVVFFGDSITIAWKERDNNVFFPGKPYLNRGISGQTTPQMLVRFQQDVVALKPAAVVILAGINDIAGNTGPSTLPMTEDNFPLDGRDRAGKRDPGHPVEYATLQRHAVAEPHESGARGA